MERVNRTLQDRLIKEMYLKWAAATLLENFYLFYLGENIMTLYDDYKVNPL